MMEWVGDLVMSVLSKEEVIIGNNFPNIFGDFSGGTVVKNPPANAGDMGSTPGTGRSHMPRSN